MEQIAKLSRNGQSSPECYVTAPCATWRYILVLLLNHLWVTKIACQTTIFGHELKAPMLLAPVGVQGIVHPEAELAVAAAARETGIPMVVSTAATRSMEEITEVLGEAHKWYQLYW